MESLLTMALLAGIACWVYQAGKQTGSRGGFRAGWRRGRRLHK